MRRVGRANEASDFGNLSPDLVKKQFSRDAHTAIYAGLLKQHGSVVEGRKAQGEAKKGNIGPKSLGSTSLRVACALRLSDHQSAL
jgi:hypothetical protein